ncbi:unnamed protein product, partial [Brassica rapa]
KRGVVDRCRGDERLVCKFAEEGRIFEILDQKLLVSTGDDETGVEQERRRMEAVIMLSLRCTGHRGELIDDQITRRKKNTKRK